MPKIIPPEIIPKPNGITKTYEASVASICKDFSKNPGIKTAKTPTTICTPAKMTIEVRTGNFPLIKSTVFKISKVPIFLITEKFHFLNASINILPCASAFAIIEGKMVARSDANTKRVPPRPKTMFIPRWVINGPARPNPSRKQEYSVAEKMELAVTSWSFLTIKGMAEASAGAYSCPKVLIIKVTNNIAG